MKITVLFNRVTILAHGRPKDILADDDTVKTARQIFSTLSALGHQVDFFEINEKTVKKLKSHPTDFFFNTAFGIGNVPKSEAEVAALLANSGKPYSGSDEKAIILTTDKITTKGMLLAAGLPVPRSHSGVNFPLIVKPSCEDCSLGIDNCSIVTNKRELDKQVKSLEKLYGTALVEEYIDGRELNVTVLGNGKKARTFPVSEIVFGPGFKNRYKIVNFAAKWQESSRDFKETVGVCPARLNGETRKKIEKMALKAFSVTGCQDYARVDIRLSKNNQPYILEVNANPAVGPNDGTTRSAAALGLSYPEFLQKIIDVAVNRFQDQRNNKS